VRDSRLAKGLIRRLVRLLGLPVAAVLVRLLRLTDRRAGVVLVYHGLAARTGDPEVELVAPHGIGLFEGQVRHLARTFEMVGAAEMPQAVASRRRGMRFPATVTFDDDLESHVSLALPILRCARAKATFFLTGATLQGPFSFWWERLRWTVASNPQRLAELFAAVGAAPPAHPRPTSVQELGGVVERLGPAARAAFEEQLGDPVGNVPDRGLSADAVRALVEAGMLIGFHTRHHHYLPSLDAEGLAAAFEDGRADLEEVVGRRFTLVAYPHGAADGRVAAAAREAGFEIGYTGVPKAVQAIDNPLLLGRLGPSHHSVAHFALQLAAALLRLRT
jgi:peptidoglycan/xylan/chitin deacetylase (PgdA/CDA1 family)